MSNEVLVFVEQRDGQVKKASLEALSAARDLNSSVHAAVIGTGVADAAAQAARFGAAKVFCVDAANLAQYSGDAYASALASCVEQSGAGIVAFGHTAMGKDLAPRVAAKLGAGLASDATSWRLDGDALHVTKPVYAGKAYKEFKASGRPVLVTLRPNAFAASEAAAAGESVAVDAPSGDFLAVVQEVLAAGSDAVPLAEAQVVVAGGRGLKGPENWNLLEELAAAFGPGVAALGASRAVVDAGWRPHSEQVGQTGKVVAPPLYIAVGISGAIQHLAGMVTSRCIVAINNDAEAPIFKTANYGIVGDAFEVVPELTKQIAALRG